MSEQKSSLEKALHLLNLFTDRHFSLTLEEIAEQSSIPKTTSFRMLASLEEFGYIQKKLNAGKIYYSLGYAFLAKGHIVSNHLDIRDLARNEMRELRDSTDLTVQLAIQDGIYALYIEQFESLSPIRVYPSIGRRVPLYSAACPRVLLAHLSEDEQNHLLSRFDYKEYTTKTLKDGDAVKKNLKEVKESGYSMSKGELLAGTVAIAVPLKNPLTDEVMAALSIIGLESHFTDDLDTYVQLLKNFSNRISGKIKIN